MYRKCGSRSKGRPQMVIISSTREETNGLGLWKQRKRKGLQAAYLVFWQARLVIVQGIPAGVGSGIV